MQKLGLRLTPVGRDAVVRVSNYLHGGMKVISIDAKSSAARAGNSVWVVDADGKNACEVVKDDGLVSPDFACWSPDGKRPAVIRFT